MFQETLEVLWKFLGDKVKDGGPVLLADNFTSSTDPFTSSGIATNEEYPINSTSLFPGSGYLQSSDVF